MPTSATQNQSVKDLPETSASRPRWNGFGYQLDTFVRILQAYLESLVGVTTFVANGTLVKNGMTIAKNMEHWQTLSSTKSTLGTWATPYEYPPLAGTYAAVAASTAAVLATHASPASSAESLSSHTEPPLSAPSPPGFSAPDDVRFSVRDLKSFDKHLATIIYACIIPTKLAKKLHIE